MSTSIRPFLCLALVWSMPTNAMFADGFESPTALFVETFAQPDAATWPAPWIELANSADVADVRAGRGHIRPAVTGYSLGRMFAPISARDVEVRFTLAFNDSMQQGIGLYVRQNGGHLDRTVPAGQGYAVFIEGRFRNQPGISLWKEEAGNEIQLLHGGTAAPEPIAGVSYHVRFRVTQATPTTTLLQARLWLITEAEPGDWQVTITDDTAVLQNQTGGIAVDSWNVAVSPALITATTEVDDIEVTAL